MVKIMECTSEIGQIDNLVDSMALDIEPVIFGKGIKLFADEDFDRKLKLIKTKKISNNVVQLHYEVVK